MEFLIEKPNSMWPFCWIGALLRSGGKLWFNVTLCWIKIPANQTRATFWRDKCDDIWTRFCCKKGDKILTSLQEAVHLIMVQYKMVNRRQLLQKSGRSDERWEFWVVTGWHIASHHHHHRHHHHHHHRLTYCKRVFPWLISHSSLNRNQPPSLPCLSSIPHRLPSGVS